MNIEVTTEMLDGRAEKVEYENCNYVVTDQWLEIWWTRPEPRKVTRRLHIPIKSVLLIDAWSE